MLCFRCNAANRETDRTDFRGVQASYHLREPGLFIADAYPVSEGHSLVIPRRHVADGLELHQPEWNAVVVQLKLRREQLRTQNATTSGWAGSSSARGRA